MLSRTKKPKREKMKTIDEKYKYDLSYQEMVNAMIDTLEDGDLTSTDLIEATVYAIRRFEEQEMKPVRHLSQVVSQGAKPFFDTAKKPKDLPLNQFRVLYEIYFNRPFKVKGLNRIGSSQEFPIHYGTVRNCLKSLTKKGYIEKPYSINDGIIVGSSCNINIEKCRHLFDNSTLR